MYAQMYPNSPCYYVAPLQTQAREIVWADPRVQTHGPIEWLRDGSEGINKQEMRLNFKNGSFIKVDGSDNYEKYRGVRYKVCIYDEYREHRPEFRRRMRPNASVLDGIDVFMGSPPDRECDYVDLAKEHRLDPKKFYIKARTHDNPFISKDWLNEERDRLIARGESDEWEREYEAIFVPGGVSKIFPMVNKSNVKPHPEILETLRRNHRRLDWYVVADPAASSTFAVLFAALDRYSKHWYLLDELYEQDQAKMTVKNIGNHIRSKCSDYQTDSWRRGYDEAATWFKNEMFDHFSEFWEPTQKAQNKKEDGLSLIKDAFLQNKITISSKCTNLFWELDNYYKDKNGKIPKENDHLIDCLRYMFSFAYYNFNETKEYSEKADENFRGAKISDDFPKVDDLGVPLDEYGDIEWIDT